MTKTLWTVTYVEDTGEVLPFRLVYPSREAAEQGVREQREENGEEDDIEWASLGGATARGAGPHDGEAYYLLAPAELAE